MKKLLIPIALLFMIMTGCASESVETGSVASESEAQIEKETPEEKETEEESKEETKAETAIEQKVIFEQDGIIITAAGLDFDGSFMGPEIKFLIENNTEKNLCIQAKNVSINGYMVETLMSTEISAGKKANDSLTISSSSIEACEIEDIAYADFSFHIFNSDSWDDSIDTEIIHIDTSCADSYVQAYDDSGEIIYENEGVKIVSKGISEDSSIMGPSLVLYVENNTENSITIQSRDVSINGFMVDPIFSCEIMPGKKAIDDITFMSSDIEENQIESIDEIELSFHIFKTDGWDTIQDTDPVTIGFK